MPHYFYLFHLVHSIIQIFLFDSYAKTYNNSQSATETSAHWMNGWVLYSTDYIISFVCSIVISTKETCLLSQLIIIAQLSKMLHSHEIYAPVCKIYFQLKMFSIPQYSFFAICHSKRSRSVRLTVSTFSSNLLTWAW